MVFSVIHEAVDTLASQDKINALPVLVNAPNFEISRVNDKGEKISEVDLLEFKRIVLQNLVRRLYELTRYYKLENGKIKYDESLVSDSTISAPVQRREFHIELRKKTRQKPVKSLPSRPKSMSCSLEL